MWRILSAVTVLAELLFAQSVSTGPQMASFMSKVDDSTQPYALYVPASFDPSKKYPLVLSLHAEDITPQVGLIRVFGQTSRVADGSLAPLRFFRPRDVDFLVASPLARGTMGYQGIAERDVYDVLADVERKFPVDEDRVFLTGTSMGGGGALRMALTRPDVWAAVAPVCPVTAPGLEALAANALNLPVRLFHGEQDPLVPVASSRLWQRRLVDLNVAADYIEYPSVRHNAWDYAYRGESLFEWFSHFRRNRFPERVRFVSDSYQYGSAYWVRIDGLTPGTPASMEAWQAAKGEVSVKTQNLDGFTLTLDHPIATVTIDGSTQRIRPASSVSFSRQNGKWMSGLLRAAAKSRGTEGPILAAVSGRHIYVYGTAGDPSSEELDYRRKIAETAAAWSTPRERLELSFAVKADQAVTQQDLDANDLVLFGTRETNSVIAGLADRLPLALAAGAADYGLLFIAPVGRHYALVSSGLPWWTDADDTARPADRYLPKPMAQLSTFGDYVLFKGSLAQVVAEGRFDRGWKVPADAAVKITAGGTVTTR